MPAAKVIDNGTYAVLVSEVGTVYKTDLPAVPPDHPAAFVLTVVLKGIAKPQSPQLRFESAALRDAFYTSLVQAMS